LYGEVALAEISVFGGKSDTDWKAVKENESFIDRFESPTLEAQP